MADEILKRDQNNQPVIGLVTDDSNQYIKMGRIDDATKGLKVMIVGGSPGTGTVTSVATGTGLTGGTITTTGTIALDTPLVPIASLTGNSLKFLRVNAAETAVEYSAVSGAGSVTSVSVATVNGVSGTVANPTTTPAITITLGNITPTSIGSTSFSGNNTFSGTNAFAALPTSSAAPVSGIDLVNKNYVDSFAQGLTVKASCNVATTANITLSGEQTIDGVLTSASRVLVKNQSTQANNGIYVSAAGAWTRATDYDQSSEVGAGTFCAIISGTTQANTLWVQITPTPTINVSSLVFTQLSSGGTGTVTSVSVTTANGVSGSVATATSTPAITLTLGAITPTSIVASGTIAGSNLSGTNTGDQAAGTGLQGTTTLSIDSTVTTLTGTQTLTNKRITKRVVTTTQSATPTINTDNTDVSNITGLAQAITSFTTNLSGTPTPYQALIICITDNGTARAITWGASFEASTVALPATTVTSTLLTVGFLWNSATSKWRCVASA